MSGAANPSHAQALVMVDELARCGVTDVVLAPGSRSTAVALALHADDRLRVHVEIDERSAGFLAIGLGRATGRPAAVVTTSGSAVANLHPAVVEADTGRVPLVVLSADRPPELRGTGANQTIDQLAIFGRAVRWFVEVGVAADVPGAVGHWRSTVCRLIAEAGGLSGPPGPVHANLAFREPTVPVSDDGRSRAAPFTGSLDGRDGRRPWLAVAPRRACAPAPDEVLDDLAARIEAAERGLLVIGQGAGPADGIDALAAVTGYPVVAEPASGARRGGHVVSTVHHLLADGDFRAAHVPDLVLRVGRVGLSRQVAGLLEASVPQVLLDPYGGWHDPERTVAELVVTDVAAACRDLVDRVAPRSDTDWTAGWLGAEAAARVALDAALDAEVAPSEPRTARDVVAAVPDGGTLVVASSMPIRDLDLFAAPREGLRVIANRGASGIDGFVSTALGVALAGPGPTVALAGDLSLLHDTNGLLVDADATSLDCTFVVVDNDGGGIFSFLPQSAEPGFERVFGTPHGRDVADLARLHHLGYVEVARADQLASAVTEAVAAGGIRVVHVRTDRRANVDLHRRLTAGVVAAMATRRSQVGPDGP